MCVAHVMVNDVCILICNGAEQEVGIHFQEIGREFGTTTGRRRRCGWLDLVVMKHSSQINGYDTLNLTKLDILDDLEEIKVAVKYVVDGKELVGFPGRS
jgi:adenylosuccinate synthase